ncbi:3-hydroxyacyl-CoA dehydrogenase NAD-binding domain-containing protein [Haliangium ochraceum]|uniref:3-hydroxyacyl-CoA dehydrogenase NAD-binding protein n=1 Tax=Haliangium ochraceum (strain DSM 14365 / JCM 11303 / SMP-2) TaxID=502025 RepID=D0LWW1_HALO1|nr:3-hydroxyacyl-CoA dehydrogenase NAD-binding domain-containing protein [Haliangium ochraceum]ACY14208.1 3-hydroxyacyl-CoA dehydrogenase NAD-binding protein [Haliangium ochraceum DSM 14365]
MSSDAISVSTDENGIAVLVIDRPDSSANYLSGELAMALLATVERLAADEDLRGVVLSSTKPGSFVHGSELREFVGAYESGLGAAGAREISRAFQHLTRRMETCGKLFAAALAGPALGSGLELALACHHRVLADDPAAVLGLPEVCCGLIPGGGGTQRLPRLIGIERALPLLLSGRPVGPAEALALGLVHALAPAGRVVDAARAWMSEAREATQPWDRRGFSLPGGNGAESPAVRTAFMVETARVRAKTQGKLPAPLALLSSVYEGTITDFDTGLRIESNYFGQMFATPVARNLMRTLFINKPAVDALAYRPREVPLSQVRTLGVIGAGAMGAGIACAAASAGIDVELIDQSAELAEEGRVYAERQLATAVQRGKLGAGAATAILARIAPSADYTRLGRCDLAIEAVYENRDLKRSVIARAEAELTSTAVLASSTSSLPIGGLARASRRPTQFLGMHFSAPAERMAMVEVITSAHTSQESLCLALDFAAQLGKTPILVNDGPAFYTTRVFSTFIDEGTCMLSEGVAPALIENAARRAGMPVGPLAEFDEVSLELSAKIIAQARADGLSAERTRADAAPVIATMMELGRRGRRYGAGFYEYPEAGKKYLWPGLGEHFPVSAEQPSVDELETRFLTIQALEAVRCVEDGVIASAAEADLGAVLGFGYPTWTGGTLSYVDMRGHARFIADCERFTERYGPRYEPSAWLRAHAETGQLFHPKTPAPEALIL